MARQRSSALSFAVALAACAGPGAPPAEPPEARPLGLIEGRALFEGPPPRAITLVGPERGCEAGEIAPAPGGARVVAPCDGVVALDGPAPGARLAHLVREEIPGGGRAWSGEGWTVRVLYGPEEDGCPGLPGHVQVKRGAEPILRQALWLRIEHANIVDTGRRAWLVLDAGSSGEAWSLDLLGERVEWSAPEAAPSDCAAP